MRKFFSKFKNVYLDLLILYIISSISIYAVLLHIDILGMKYLIPIVILLIILCIFNSFIVLYRKINKVLRTIITVLFTIMAAAFIIGSVVLLNVFSSVQNMFSTKSYVEYSVLVNKESSYKKIGDVEGKIIGYYKEDKYHDSAEEKLSKEVNCEYIGYSTLDELEKSLLDNEIDAMLILDSYLDVMTSESENNEEVENNGSIDDFDNKTRVIYKFKVDVDNSNKTKEIDVENGSFAVFVSGQDSYADSVSDASRSDVNMLMVVNLKTKQILLLSIPRDYYLNISGKNAYDKLTHISIYGAETAAETLGNTFDCDVDYFVKFNFTTFMRAIEYMLPLDVYSDYDFTTGVYDQTIGDSYTFKKGYNHITTGPMALQFVRARKNFAEGDRQRGINQTRMLRAVINKATTPQVLLKYNDILKALEGTFLTNISDESVIQIIKYVINNNGKFNVSSYSVTGYDASRACYSSGSTPLYVMIPDYSTVDIASGYIKDVLEGRVPDIETDASELIDSSNSHDVTTTPYSGPLKGQTYSSKSTNENTKKVDEKDKEDDKEKLEEEKETDKETEKDDENETTDDENNESDNENESNDSNNNDDENTQENNNNNNDNNNEENNQNESNEINP